MHNNLKDMLYFATIILMQYDKILINKFRLMFNPYALYAFHLFKKKMKYIYTLDSCPLFFIFLSPLFHFFLEKTILHTENDIVFEHYVWNSRQFSQRSIACYLISNYFFLLFSINDRYIAFILVNSLRKQFFQLHF